MSLMWLQLRSRYGYRKDKKKKKVDIIIIIIIVFVIIIIIIIWENDRGGDLLHCWQNLCSNPKTTTLGALECISHTLCLRW